MHTSYTCWEYRYRVRLSGHYYPHELRNILNTVKPKKLVPIHTRHPSLVLKLANV